MRALFFAGGWGRHEACFAKGRAGRRPWHDRREKEAILGLCPRGYPEKVILAWADDLDPGILGRVLSGKASVGFVLEDGGAALGAALFQAGRIKALYVRPGCWGMGAGGILLGACESLARKRGLRRVALFAALDSRDFYVGRGYLAVEEGARQLPGGLLLKGCEMQKDLV